MQTIIVGGGLGGLAAAIRLALQGHEVRLFERNERVGGKLNLVEAGPYTFDTGPSLLTMPWVLRDLFAAAGRRLEEELTLLPVTPTCRYRWPDGTCFDQFQDLPALVQAIQHLEPRDVRNLFRFMAYAARIYELVSGPFLLRPLRGVRDVLTPAMARNAMAIDSLRTVDSAVRSFFHSPYLRQVFNRYATYNGSSPYLAPATFNLIAHIELTEGGWYLQGGMYQLACALQRLATSLGVVIETGTEVQRITLRGGRAAGVVLADGREVAAGCVVVNADPRYAYTRLLGDQAPADARREAARLGRLEPSCSGFILLLGIDRDYPQLAHHNIFFSADYRREFAAIFQKGVPAPDPTIYVCATCRSDAQHAPPGHMNLFVLVNAPALNPRVNWTREAGAYRDLVIAKLERMGLSGLGRHIVVEQCWTPETLQQRYYATGGAIYGLASNSRWSAFLRTPLQARGIEALYFVGGGTHPGGGIPLVLLSGRAVADLIGPTVAAATATTGPLSSF